MNYESSGGELKFNQKLIKNKLKLNQKLSISLLQVMDDQSWMNFMALTSIIDIAFISWFIRAKKIPPNKFWRWMCCCLFITKHVSARNFTSSCVKLIFCLQHSMLLLYFYSWGKVIGSEVAIAFLLPYWLCNVGILLINK